MITTARGGNDNNNNVPIMYYFPHKIKVVVEEVEEFYSLATFLPQLLPPFSLIHITFYWNLVHKDPSWITCTPSQIKSVIHWWYFWNYNHASVWYYWLVPDFGGRYLDTDLDFSRYRQFCGTIIYVRTDINPNKGARRTIS